VENSKKGRILNRKVEKLTHGLDVMARGSALGKVVPREISDGNLEILDTEIGVFNTESGDNRKTRGSEGGVRDLGPHGPRLPRSFEIKGGAGGRAAPVKDFTLQTLDCSSIDVLES
jgi:hypothetical protein